MMEEAVGRFELSGDLAPTLEKAAPLADAESVVAIVDPSRLRRECLKLALLQHSPRWQITEAAAAEELVRRAQGGARFDLVLTGAATAEYIDLREIEALRQALPEAPIVVVAESDNPQRVRQILSAGVRGYLPASLSLKVLMGALDLVLAGGVYVPSSLIDANPARQAWLSGGSSANEPWHELTRRQRDVLALISQGKSNKLIADALTMSESTVKAHVKQIIKRLHVANRTQAALVATGRGSFTPALNGRNGRGLAGAGLPSAASASALGPKN
jgi:DNA-binding NarL/FixJ family response regulator